MRTSIYERVAALTIVAAAAGLPTVVSCGSSSSGSPDASTSHDASSNSDATSGNQDAPPAETSLGDSATDAGIDSTMATDSGADSGPETGLGEGGATVARYLGTQPPGDVWTWTLDHGAGTFSAQDETNGYTYSGTISQVTGTGIVGNGFTRLSIASTTDPAASSWLKHEAFAVELPGVALLVSPPGPPALADGGVSNGYYSSLIVASAVGTCPATGGTFNTIVIPRTTWASQGSLLMPGESVTGPGYGTATLGLSGGSFTISGTTTGVTLTYTDAGDWTITDAGVTSIPSATFGCDGGYLTSATAGTPTIGVTPAGVLIEDMGGADPSISGLIGVAQTAIAGLGVLQGEYLGFIFVNEAAVPPNLATPYTIAVSCTPGSSADAGNEICQPYDSLDPVTPSTFGIGDAAVQIPVFFDTTSTTTGVIDNHTTNFNGTPGLFSQNVSMVTQIGGKAVLVGITGSGSVPSLQNMMLIQQ